MSAMNSRREVIGGVKWTTFSAISLASFQIIKVSVLARFLDKSDFGLMSLILFVLGFMNLFMDMGLTSAILHRQDISRQEYSSLYFLNLLFSLFLYLIMVLIAPPVALFYKQAELVKLLPLMGISIIFAGIGRQYKTVLQKGLDFRTIAMVEVSGALLSVIFAVILATRGAGVYSLVLSALLQYALTNILFAAIGVSRDGLIFHFVFAETRPFLKIGIYQVGSQCVNYFSRDLDILIIGKIYGSELLGGYSLAKQLVMRPIQLLNPVVTKIASPVLAKLQGDIKLLQQKYIILVKVLSTINLPIYIMMILFAPFIIRVMYGTGYESIIILVRLLSVYMFMRVLNNPAGSLVIATGKTNLEFYWGLFSLLIMPVVILTGSFFGLIGIALAMIISSILLIIPFWQFLIKRLINISFSAYLKGMVPYFRLSSVREILGNG